MNVECHSGSAALQRLQDLALVPATGMAGHPADNIRWAPALTDGLHHEPHLLVPEGGREQGGLMLMYVKSRLFGKFLVSMPFISTGGVRADSDQMATALIDRAIELANSLDVKYLEFRHETPIDHPQLVTPEPTKVHCRLQLPAEEAGVLKQLKAKVRNLVKRGMENDFQVQWGRMDLLPGFYQVFSRNMRDLGSPVFGRQLFVSILDQFGDDAEICLVSHEGRHIAGAILVHDELVTEVPSASCLREYNRMNANMFMYLQLLCRAVARGSKIFDFGRSTIGSGTHRFKKQWRPDELIPTWQYYVRHGDVGSMRKESGKFALAVRMWQKLPVWFANLIGPSISRCIP